MKVIEECRQPSLRVAGFVPEIRGMGNGDSLTRGPRLSKETGVRLSPNAMPQEQIAVGDFG